MSESGFAEVEEPARPSRRKSVLGALRFHDFRLLWIGLFLSNIGSWMQLTALGYLVVHLAKTPATAVLWAGYVGLAQAIPALIVSPVAGVVADMFPRRMILWNTNVGSALCAALLAVMVESGFTGFVPIVMISALASAIRALDVPARQSWIPQLVDREYISNAIGLNSIAFNAPSIAGPVMAGILLSVVPISYIFFANAVLTLAVIVALTFMKPAPREEYKRTPIVRSFRDGILYLCSDVTLRFVMIGLFFCALLVRPYLILMPAFALTVIGADPMGLGILYSASGIGAVFGALTTAYIGNVPYRMRLWSISGCTLGVSVILLGFSRDVLEASPWALSAGYATMLFVGSTNILIQTLTPEQFRGRAIAAYSMILLGLVPLGSLLLGAFAQSLGLRMTYNICGAVFLLIQMVIWKMASRN